MSFHIAAQPGTALSYLDGDWDHLVGTCGLLKTNMNQKLWTLAFVLAFLKTQLGFSPWDRAEPRTALFNFNKPYHKAMPPYWSLNALLVTLWKSLFPSATSVITQYIFGKWNNDWLWKATSLRKSHCINEALDYENLVVLGKCRS